MKAICSLLCLVCLIFAAVGCEAESRQQTTPVPVVPTNHESQPAEDDVADQAESETPAENQTAEDEGLVNSVGKALGDATDAGLSAASDSATYVGELFDSLKEKGLTTADTAKQWASEDFQAMGTWEYKVEFFSPNLTSEKEIAEFEKQLNTLGRDRWECFHVQGTVHYFRRPRRSYLRNVPMKDLIKLVPLMPSGE